MRMPGKSWFTALAIILFLPACEFLPGGGGGGTGGGGGSAFTFDKGFAFVRRDDRNIYLVDDADPQITTLTTSANVRTPSFSADGTQLVFVRGGAMESELAIVPTAGGIIRTVLSTSAGQRSFKTPVFSPDGTQIAFGFDDGSSTRIGLINADGTNSRTMASGGLSQAYPSFTPDGTALIVAAGTALGYTQIERITIATNAVTNVTNVLGNEAMGIANRLVISPDGTKAAFDAQLSSGVTRLFVIDLGSKVVSRPYAGEPGANDTFPCWLGSTALAFSSDSGGNDNVYRVNLPVSTSPSLLVPKAIEPWYGVTAR